MSVWRNHWRALMEGEKPNGDAIEVGQSYEGWTDHPTREAAEADAAKKLRRMSEGTGIYRQAEWLGAKLVEEKP